MSRVRVAVAALALVGFGLAGYRAVAQDPSPIPNWPTDEQGATPSQYSQGQQYGQPQYQQPPAYGQQQGYPQQGYPQQQQSYNSPTQGFAQPFQPSQALSPDHLEQMVAPIALYPDNLVSMVLAGSTYPAQVAAADQWLHMQGGAPPEQIAAGANTQTTWDPSIKALTAFPQVLDQMAQNLQWTTDLGNAYYNQPQDVMQTIQVMRDRAQAAGNLQSTPQQEVIQDQGNIEIAPPTPQVVYVPQYNPWAAYGQPVDPYPGFNVLGAIGSFIGNAFLQFGPGIAMNAFSVTPFGWLGWGLDWLSHAIFFGGDVWCTHSGSVRDWGFAHGGGRYWGAHGELAGFRDRGGWGGRGGWEHNTFRSGLDRGNFPHATSPTPRAFNGGQRAYGGQGNFGNRSGEFGRGFQGSGNTYGRGNGYQGNGNTFGRGNGYQSSGNSYGYGQRGGGNGYGQSGNTFAHGGGYGQNGGAYGRSNGYGQSGYGTGNRIPEATGRPQQYGSAREYAQGGYNGGRQSNGYIAGGHESYGGSSGLYSHPLQNYGMRPGFGGGNTQAYRSPSYGAGSPSRSYNYGGNYSGSYGNSNRYSGSSMYGGSSIARAPSSGGFHPFGGGHSSGGYNYGGGSYKAPKAQSYGGGGHSFFGGGGGGYKAPKAPHFSGGGGSHFGGGGGGHFGGGGGGHFGGGGHSGGGHSGGGHSGKHH